MRKGWIGLAIMAIVIPALFGFTVPAEAITGKQYDTGYMGGILRLGNNGSHIEGYLGKPDGRINYETLDIDANIYSVGGHDSIAHLIVEVDDQDLLGLYGVIYHPGSQFWDKVKTELDNDKNMELIRERGRVRVYRSKTGVKDQPGGLPTPRGEVLLLHRKPGTVDVYIILDDMDGRAVVVTTSMPQWENALR